MLFYVAGGAAAAAAGAAPLTRAARLPLLGLFGGSLLAERCLPPRLHSLLRAGHKGQVCLLLFFACWLDERSCGACLLKVVLQCSQAKTRRQDSTVQRQMIRSFQQFEISMSQMLLQLPLPKWLPVVPATGLSVDFKLLLRRLCLALGIAATVCAAITFRNVEKENLRWGAPPCSLTLLRLRRVGLLGCTANGWPHPKCTRI